MFNAENYPQFLGICFGWVFFTAFYFFFRDILKSIYYLIIKYFRG